MAHFLTLFPPLFLSSLLLTPEWLLRVAVGTWGAETEGRSPLATGSQTPGDLWHHFAKPVVELTLMEGSEEKVEGTVPKAGSSFGLSLAGNTALS